MNLEKTEKTFNLKFRNIECSKMTDEDISATSLVFSDNYGIWSMDNPNVKQQGMPIKFPESKIIEYFVNKPDRYVALAYDDTKLIGHIFYLKRTVGNKTIIWVLQLVVSKQYRNNRIATKMLHSIWKLSDCYAWGLYTSNPMTIRALENATMRKVNVNLINKRIELLKAFAFDIFDNMDWIENYDDGIVDTSFYVDHSDLNERIKKYGKNEFPMNVNLPSGKEWLAFTFRDQQPGVSSLDELEYYMEFSEDILKEAYSNMNMSIHGWASHTKDEIDYLINNNYIKKSDKVIDVGCGMGRHTVELNDRNIKTLGVDFSDKNIFAAKKSSNNNYFECLDIRKEIPNDKYDVALCLYDVVGSFPDEEDNLKILKSINKLLLPGGKIVLSVMNMTLTQRLCKTKVDGIEDNVDKLLKLRGSNTMQSTGNVFKGKYLLIDEQSGIVYRKEQFLFEDALPCEYVVRDRRYTMSGIQHLLNKAGFVVDNSFYFKAGRLNKPLSENQIQAKEIFLVAHKADWFQRKLYSLIKMPQAWK